MTRKYPPVVVVDENDNEVGAAMLSKVWQKGLYHRIVSVYVLDGAGRMLLQLRSQNVKIYPNRWDQAAGGHVDQGFSYDQTAKNELAEELGIRDVALKQLGTFRSNAKLDECQIINQFERVYSVQVPSDTSLRVQAEEVSTARWFTPNELRTLVSQQPENLTPGLLHGLHEYFPEFGL